MGQPHLSFAKNVVLIVVLVICPLVAFTQDRCGAVEYTAILKEQGLLRETNPAFERWLLQKQKERAGRTGPLRTKETYQVPVVVHVIHNGETLGLGKNISDAQIISQLSVLNKDYQRLNADAANTPAEFQGVAGAFDLEFVLARQNPEGLATNGIVRVQGTKTSWTINDNYQLKSLSYWPAEDYLNIWVCNLSDFLGYAQFPVSGLPGLENSSTNSLTDGVVIAYNAFGSSDDGAFNLLANYSKGRTATHEIGHFFGLKHIWGDDDGACDGTDYVNDTPNQAGSTGGCPAHPRLTCSNVTSMFQNYLDYTNDVCMNLFTQGQVERMITIIENSPRRASLTSSHGLADPLPVANDLGIKNVITPQPGECSTTVTPAAEVRNYGGNTISSARIRIRKDGVITETKDFTFTPALGALESTAAAFAPLAFTGGNHNVTFEILLTNGAADPQASNNTMSQDFFIPPVIAVPFLETFNSVPSSWTILNPDQNRTWELASAPAGAANTAMKMDFFNYEDHTGEIDLLLTPVFDLTSAPAALLKFDVSHARFQSSNDGLKVILLEDCNTDISQGTVVYDKSGASLATVSSTSAVFTPAGAGDWRNEGVDLSLYAGQDHLQLAFVGYNDWGNNLYVDNISLTTDPVHDVSLTAVVAPSPVSCLNQVIPGIHIKNTGTLVGSLRVVASVNGQNTTHILSGLSIPGNTEADIELDQLSLSDGENEITFEITEVNGSPDFNPADNTIFLRTVVNKATDAIPIRQNFEGVFENTWTIVNPSDGMNWQKKSVEKNTALYFNGFANSLPGDAGWLVSPVLDFSAASEAGLSYDLSYAYRSNTSDQFYILASTDCGYTFSDTLLFLQGNALAEGKSSSVAWEPGDESDWSTNFIALPGLAGQPDTRVAFVFVNDKGNNIYIDNIEFYVSDSPLKLDEPFAVHPNPVEDGIANITFNLPEKDDVLVDIADPVGKILISENLTGILNQTFPFSLSGRPAGLYFVRVRTSDQVIVKKILVIR